MPGVRFAAVVGSAGLMRRVAWAGLLLIAAGWLGVVGAQSLGDPTGRVERAALGLAALLTAGWHTAASLLVAGRPGRRAAEAGPAWTAVQAERHRRLANRFAAWGLATAALAGLVVGLASLGRLGWPWVAPLVAAINLGCQPGLLLAEGWAIMAQGRSVALARSVA